MSYRSGKEFSSYVYEAGLKRAGHSCEQCGSITQLEAHHLLPLAIARDYFPQLAPHVLSSIENLKILCAECHDTIHRNPDFVVYWSVAQTLLGIQDRLL